MADHKQTQVHSTVPQLEYPLDEKLPEMGKTIEIAPGLFWLRMRLPFALDHINLWLLQDQINGIDGWTIVDCGISNDETKHAWEQIFASSLNGLPVLRVLVTHMHPDHIGLAQWLCERWQAPLWISLSDYLTAQWLTHQEGGVKVGAKIGSGGSADHFARHGLQSEEDLAKIRARASYYTNLVPAIPVRYRRLMEGDSVVIGKHVWEIMMGYGHAPEHATLFCKNQNILISGDMVLPRISTNVSVYDADPDADPLGLYLNSLERYLNLPPDAFILPSHGKPFHGLHTRIAQLKAHHVARLADTFYACSTPKSAREVVPILFKRDLDIHQLTFAMGEAIAHLNHLWRQGSLSRQLFPDGILRFCAL